MLGRNQHEEYEDGNFDRLKADVEKILQFELASDESREEHKEFVSRVLGELWEEVNRIGKSSNGYPANPISALVWMTGSGYANLGCALTEHFHSGDWLENEERASALWSKATLTVCSHYHHMVGPAMLANADCHERLGNEERATQMYTGVVLDFAFIADDWMEEPEAPVEEDRVALESLQTAAERLLAQNVEELDGVDVKAIHERTSLILARPIQA